VLSSFERLPVPEPRGVETSGNGSRHDGAASG